MKQTVKTSRAAGQLEKMFRELNKHYFAGKLPEPIISLKKTPSAYGHITCSKVWQAGGENKYEINISSATLDRPIEETASTLLHEMVHEYCMETGIKDTSNNGVYHNRRFKEQAEAHGLTVDHHEKYGWTITSPSEELLDFIIFQGWQDIQMGERLAWSDMAGTGAGSKAPGSSQTGAPKPPKAKSSTRRWVCPKCGTIIRSTKEVRVICADCMELFVKADLNHGRTESEGTSESSAGYKAGGSSWILIKSLLTPFLPRRPSAKPVVAPSLLGQTSHSKTSSCTRTGTSQSCISWPGTPCFPSPLPAS